METNPKLSNKVPQVMLNIAETCYDRAMNADVKIESIEEWQQLSTEILEKYVIGKTSGPTLMTGYYVLGLNYYAKGRIAQTKGNTEEAKVNYRKAINEWQSLIDEFPNSKNTAKAYYSTGVLYTQELGEYQKGIDCFQKINNDFPNFEYALDAKRLHNKYSEKQNINNNNIEGK
jgi:tetratricopeptide (TPR) repeat protein